jgi:hypothetical protein
MSDVDTVNFTVFPLLRRFFDPHFGFLQQYFVRIITFFAFFVICSSASNCFVIATSEGGEGQALTSSVCCGVIEDGRCVRTADRFVAGS